MSFHSRKYPQLNDPEWLNQKYIVEKLSTIDISKMLNIIAPNSVRQALLGAGIIPRSASEGLRVNNEELNIDLDVLYGSLLGDGYMCKYNKHSNISMPYFGKTNKHRDHVLYVASYFYDNYTQYVFDTTYTINGKILTYNTLKTKSDEKLVDHYNKWYPSSNDYNKVVPTDIKLTPNMILHWFLDDGSTSYRTRNGILTSQVVGTLSSQSFTLDENILLVSQLNNFIPRCAKITSCSTGTRSMIRIRQSKINEFYELIGECPFDSLKYKWKL